MITGRAIMMSVYDLAWWWQVRPTKYANMKKLSSFWKASLKKLVAPKISCQLTIYWLQVSISYYVSVTLFISQSPLTLDGRFFSSVDGAGQSCWIIWYVLLRIESIGGGNPWINSTGVGWENGSGNITHVRASKWMDFEEDGGQKHHSDCQILHYYRDCCLFLQTSTHGGLFYLQDCSSELATWSLPIYTSSISSDFVHCQSIWYCFIYSVSTHRWHILCCALLQFTSNSARLFVQSYCKERLGNVGEHEFNRSNGRPPA